MTNKEVLKINSLPPTTGSASALGLKTLSWGGF